MSAAKSTYKTIEVQLRSHYGMDRIYPVNDIARLLLELTGRKTFYLHDLETLTKAGYCVIWKPAELDFKGG